MVTGAHTWGAAHAVGPESTAKRNAGHTDPIRCSWIPVCWVCAGLVSVSGEPWAGMPDIGRLKALVWRWPRL